MHWTALLAYRRFPPNAEVIDDLTCIACGYNLRGLRVAGQCPECGRPVGDSLFVLAKPTEVGQYLNGVAKSFLAFYGTLLGCAAGTSLWAPIVIACIVSFGSAWRLITLLELRYRGAISTLPVIGTRLRLLIFCTVLDLMAGLGWLAASLALAKLPAFATSSGTWLMVMTFVAWICATLLSAAAAGWLGLAFSTMLGYGWMQIEFKVQLASIGITALGALGMIILLAGKPALFILKAGAGLASFVMAVSMLMTVIALIHLANAAEQEHETWDEAIDAERIAIAAAPPNPSPAKPEPPAIKLARPDDHSSGR